MVNVETADRERGITDAQYAAVRILDVPYHVDKPYSYYIPFSLSGCVLSGCFVLVPFGGGANRRVMGIVTEIFRDLPEGVKREKCKPIAEVVSDEFVLTEELLLLCRFLMENTFCTYGDAARAVIPTGALRKLYQKYETAKDEGAYALYLERYGKVDCPERELYEGIRRTKGVRQDMLEKRFGEGSRTVAEKLLKKGILVRKTYLSGTENSVVREYVKSNIPEDALYALIMNRKPEKTLYHYNRKSENYRNLLKKIYELHGSEISREDLTVDDSVQWKTVTDLEKDGILSVRRIKDYRNPYAGAASLAPPDDNILSEEQEQARQTLSQLYQTGEAKAALLHGVTGSGKTRVIKAMMDEVIRDGRQVIMLVPEISLTPQSVAIFCAYYGERVAVVHSGLSAGERLDVWRRARNGEVDLVIGTRSAVFVPFTHLGMIVIDEEQEHTYKSDLSPKYHARDAARFRCAQNNALLLLASATPSLESYYKAERGFYTLVKLKNRYGGACLPEVIMADMHDSQTQDGTPLSDTLACAIKETMEKGEQAILFINRRGYHRYIACLSCRQPILCPHCSVPMTLHQRKGVQEDGAGVPLKTYEDGTLTGVLTCHYCGEKMVPPKVCPGCKSEHLHAFGYGTERAEEDVAARFPQIRTVRMDFDTTQSKFAHEEILNTFREHKADILLGTQMVAKGHDFPNVTLVGVLSADALLFGEDYRATEKAFSLITQVIGRAGRGALAGRAIIQTYDPDHEVLRLAAAQDYESFYHGAIRMREAMTFPPFCEMVLFTFSSPEEQETIQAAQRFFSTLTELTAPTGEYYNVPIILFGPFEAQIYKLNERYRMRIIAKCRLNKRTRALIQKVMAESSARNQKRVVLSVDVNPNNL